MDDKYIDSLLSVGAIKRLDAKSQIEARQVLKDLPETDLSKPADYAQDLEVRHKFLVEKLAPVLAGSARRKAWRLRLYGVGAGILLALALAAIDRLV